VAEAFVFGKPDERWGEAVHAACALKRGVQVSEAQLIGFVAQRLARYKRPQSIRFTPGPLDRAAKY
jgi:long-chain acyl-CoA synthetase